MEWSMVEAKFYIFLPSTHLRPLMMFSSVTLYSCLFIQPGDKWTLPDQCHTVTCFPGDYTVLESHQINCERMPKPVCHSNLPAVKVEETCGCRWMCPCEYLSLNVCTPSPSLEIFIRKVMLNSIKRC